MIVNNDKANEAVHLTDLHEEVYSCTVHDAVAIQALGSDPHQ